jgi:hypothetical protein
VDRETYLALIEAAGAVAPVDTFGPLPDDPAARVIVQRERHLPEATLITEFAYRGTAEDYTLQSSRTYLIGPEGVEIPEPAEPETEPAEEGI